MTRYERVRRTFDDPCETITATRAPWHGLPDGTRGRTPQGWSWELDGTRVYVTGPEGTQRTYVKMEG